jgi:probable selenium-dependent hydroxylase accessory protein YqeC
MRTPEELLGNRLNLLSALGVRYKEVISLVGGGGKTTLMFALAREIVTNRPTVITTTTTKIWKPTGIETYLIVDADEERLVSRTIDSLGKYRHVTLASEQLPDGKLKGITRELVDVLIGLDEIHHVIVEADGAAGKSIKAPNDFEPVIPWSTSLVIPILGLDALGKRLSLDVAFRQDIVSKITGLIPGDKIHADAIATLLVHKEGMTKGSPNHARIVPFLNKLDLVPHISEAQNLARIILKKGQGQIERVVLGQLNLLEPIVDVVINQQTTDCSIPSTAEGAC